jgi:regulator of RNase E activity RraB
MAEETWEPAFDFYVTRLDGALASVVVDLHARPLESHGHCVVVSTTLKVARADGLRDSSELDAVGRVEDELVEVLSARDALYVGRVVTRGEVRFVFYVRGAPDVMAASVRDYRLTWKSSPDPDWATFARVLFPSRWELQTMLNRRLLSQLEAQGDTLAAKREVDHLAFFESAVQAEAATTALAARGFRVDGAQAEEEGRVGLEFHRADFLGDGRIDAVCHELLGLLEPLEGEYDGWGCAIVQANAGPGQRS